MKSAQATALALFAAGVAQAQSGAGVTTRYWDCCKQSCGWSQKAAVGQPVLSCDSAGSKLLNPDTKSGCDGGEAFTCTDNQPWAINDDLAYGFAAVSIAGSSEAQWCCECYELTFTSTAVEGKKLIVQATNTGGDLGANHFDLLIPGGGLGIFTEGCPAQFGTWNGGLQYGGVSSREDCNNLPASVQAGCFWRFDWFKNADNPSVNFTKTACPSELIAKSGCQRSDAAPPTTVTVTGTPLPGPTTTTTVSSTLNSTVTTSTVPTATNPIPSDPSSSPSEPSPSPSPSPSDPGSVAQWGQCGGVNYTGPTQCVSPFKCNKVNDYYSQCY